MLQRGLPYIPGYKPRGNYQELLRHAVIEQLAVDPSLEGLARQSAEAPACPLIPTAQISGATSMVDPPGDAEDGGAERAKRPAQLRVTTNDYLAMESRNRSLGLAGEKFVVELEHKRLWTAGRKDLAERIDHVAASEGDGLGYDTLSFEKNGSERLIEVKTTKYGQFTPFFVSRNEVDVSAREAAHYHLVRLFEFQAKPRAFILSGALENVATLEASVYRATLR
jgi:hypothetical protein